MFKSISNRDDWARIRGFAYQVYVAVLRWFDLKQEEILELEKAEDMI